MNDNSQKNIFGIHGGGCIGLGLIADVVSKNLSFEIIATSNNTFRKDLINSTGKYWLQHSQGVSCIRLIKIISRNQNDLIELYSRSRFIALCITPQAFSTSVREIAIALMARNQNNIIPLTLFIVMNIPNSDKFVYQHLMTQLLLLCEKKYLAIEILKSLKIIPTIVDRIVSPVPIEQINNELYKQLNHIPKHQLTSELNEDKVQNIVKDRVTLIRAIKALHLQFSLFNVEKRFSIHVPTTYKNESKLFPGIQASKNIVQLMLIKNKLINGPHAILAWAGALLGCKTIAETIANPTIYDFINKLMRYEIRPILLAECTDFTESDFNQFQKNFIDRCHTNTTDPVRRVGRDPLRKLQSAICGTIELRNKHNLSVSTSGLEKGIALGVLYALTEIDPLNTECQTIKKIYNRYHSYAAILYYRNNLDHSYCFSKRIQDDKAFINNVIHKIVYFRDAIKNRRLLKTILH